MTAKDTYQIFIGDNCPSCEKVISFMKMKGLDIAVVNIDHDTSYELPFSLVIVPALVKNKELKAYGVDIITHLTAE